MWRHVGSFLARAVVAGLLPATSACFDTVFDGDWCDPNVDSSAPCGPDACVGTKACDRLVNGTYFWSECMCASDTSTAGADTGVDSVDPSESTAEGPDSATTSSGSGTVGAADTSTSNPTGGSESSSGDSSSDETTGGAISCTDVEAIPGFCEMADNLACVCHGCVDDGDCEEGAEDCVCPDCANDAASYCNARYICTDDGTCFPMEEGCNCADCAAHPACP